MLLVFRFVCISNSYLFIFNHFFIFQLLFRNYFSWISLQLWLIKDRNLRARLEIWTVLFYFSTFLILNLFFSTSLFLFLTYFAISILLISTWYRNFFLCIFISFLWICYIKIYFHVLSSINFLFLLFSFVSSHFLLHNVLFLTLQIFQLWENFRLRKSYVPTYWFENLLIVLFVFFISTSIYFVFSSICFYISTSWKLHISVFLNFSSVLYVLHTFRSSFLNSIQTFIIFLICSYSVLKIIFIICLKNISTKFDAQYRIKISFFLIKLFTII